MVSPRQPLENQALAIDNEAASHGRVRSAPPIGHDSMVVPRPRLRSEALTYRLLKPQDCGPTDLPLLAEAYDCWRSTWEQMRAELAPTDFLASDDFSRQSEIGAVFHDWECTGMTAFRWMDLSNRIYHDDSYFQRWPRAAIDAACRQGSRVCVGSNLLVGPAWRNAAGVSVKELLLALAIERFLAIDDSDVLVGTMRNNRGMNTLGYRLGFVSLAKDLPFYGDHVRVDLVAFYRKTSARGRLAIEAEELIQSLYPGVKQ